MNMERTIRFGVAGLKHGQEHVRAILAHPRAELAVCCDLDENLFHSLKLPPEIGFTKNFDDMIRRNDLDAVVISLPTPLHAEYSILSMEAGKDVLCEKPLALTVEEGMRICEAIRRTGRVFQLGYEVRYSPFQQKILEICRSGEIGTVTNVWWNMFCERTNTGWRNDRKNFGGKLFDCGCHYYNLMETWAGAPAKRLCVFGNEIGQTGPTADVLPQTAIVMFEYANGVRGVFNLSDHCPNMQNSTCGIAGTNGKIEADPYYPDQAGSLDVHAQGGKFRYNIRIQGYHSEKFTGGHLGFYEQYEAFISSILEHAPVQVTAEQGIWITRILSAIDRSLSTGNAVSIE